MGKQGEELPMGPPERPFRGRRGSLCRSWGRLTPSGGALLVDSTFRAPCPGRFGQAWPLLTTAGVRPPGQANTMMPTSALGRREGASQEGKRLPD